MELPKPQRFALPSDTTWHKWQCTAPRAIVILQRGFGEYAERYTWSHSKLTPKITAENLEVWALDLCGHGQSPGIRGMVDGSMAVQDHLQLRNQAATQQLPIFYLGHSLGGLVTAASIVEGSPARIDGVILSGPALPGRMPVLTEAIIRLFAWIMPHVAVPVPRSPFGELCHDIEQVRLAQEDPLMYQGQIPFLVASTALRTAGVMWGKLGQWTAPTLVIHGTKDSYADFRQNERFVEGIVPTDKTLHLVEGGYHKLPI